MPEYWAFQLPGGDPALGWTEERIQAGEHQTLFKRVMVNGSTGKERAAAADVPSAINAFAAGHGVAGAIPSERYPLQVPGKFHPRIWRTSDPPMLSPHKKEWIATEASTRFAYEMLRDIFDVVDPDPATATSYGHRIRHFLILASTEVEAAWTGILKANGYPGNRWTTNDYVKLRLPMRLGEWKVRLPMYPDYPEIQPFGGWDPGRPTQSLGFYDAYNTVKHDREAQLNKARLDHAISAAAAMYVMALAQFGSPTMGADGMFQATSRPVWTPAECYYPNPEDSQAWTPVNRSF